MSDRLEQATDGQAETKGFSGWIAGRARRRECCAWALPLSVVVLTMGATGVPGATLLLGVPMLLITIRRLHDLGVTGWVAPLVNVVANALAFAATLAASEDAASRIAVVAFYGPILALCVLPGQPSRGRRVPTGRGAQWTCRNPARTSH